MRPIDEYFHNQQEPTKSCLQTLRSYLLNYDLLITEAWKYGMPFFLYKDKMFCYLWVHKTHQLPYLGIVVGNKLDHPDLIREKRAKMKILLIDPEADIPTGKIDEILQAALKFYK